MHRRTYLGLAVGTMAGVAGCTASALPGPDWSERQTPGPDECPELIDADRTVCPGVTDGPLSVDRSAETVSASASAPGEGWTLNVLVSNRSPVAYGCNPYAWAVYREARDGWDRVAPDAHIEPWMELAPGERYTWQLGTAEGPAPGVDQRVFLDLDPGRFAFAVPFDGVDRVAVVVPFTVTP